MKKIDGAALLKNIRSLRVGGSVGSSLGMIGLFAFPAMRRSGVSVEAAAVIGVALGTAIHGSILPILLFFNHYLKLGEILFAMQRGWLEETEARQMMRERQLKYFECAARKTRSPRECGSRTQPEAPPR
jgi:hypothetical protein